MDYEISQAERHLRSALRAYEKADEKARSTKNLIADWNSIFSLLSLASESVVETEKLDPHVSFTDGPETITAMVMRARLFRIEGFISTTPGLPDHALRAGIATLNKYYYQYGPRDVKALNRLTDAYIRVYERDNAIGTNRTALNVDPSDIEARELRDRLTYDPTLAQPLTYRNYIQQPQQSGGLDYLPSMLAILATLGLIAFIIYVLTDPHTGLQIFRRHLQ